jgi:Ca2+-binding EF-hand superfamily protein
LSAILRLQISWPQFDSIWSSLDRRKNGDIGHDDFLECFSASATSISSKLEIEELAVIFCEVSSVIHRVSLSVDEVLGAFDRNGSGNISVSEFCNLIRLILRPKRVVDKQSIYKSFFVLDANGDRSLSTEEMRLIIYKMWRTQLDVFALKGYVKEREALKLSISRNFSRKWRDSAEIMYDSMKEPLKSVLDRVLVLCSNHSQTTNRLPRKKPPVKSKTTSQRIASRISLINSAEIVVPRRKGFELSLPNIQTIDAGGFRFGHL